MSITSECQKHVLTFKPYFVYINISCNWYFNQNKVLYVRDVLEV